MEVAKIEAKIEPWPTRDFVPLFLFRRLQCQICLRRGSDLIGLSIACIAGPRNEQAPLCVLYDVPLGREVEPEKFFFWS
jgi:hypothetical protein